MDMALQMQAIAKTVAATIAKTWRPRMSRGGARTARHREVQVDFDRLGGRGHAKKIARAATEAVRLDKPSRFDALPVFQDAGLLMGREISPCGSVTVRWRVFYDGFTGRHAGAIDWLTDADKELV